MNQNDSLTIHHMHPVSKESVIQWGVLKNRMEKGKKCTSTAPHTHTHMHTLVLWLHIHTHTTKIHSTKTSTPNSQPSKILTAHQHPAKWHTHTNWCSINTWLPSLMNKWNDPIRAVLGGSGRVWPSSLKEHSCLSLALSPVSVTFVKAIWDEKLFK